MKELSDQTPRKPLRSPTWLYGCLALLLLAQIALAGLAPPPQWISGDTPAKWYVRSGQWRADARTLVAGVRFLFDLDGGVRK